MGVILAASGVYVAYGASTISGSIRGSSVGTYIAYISITVYGGDVSYCIWYMVYGV